MFKKLRIWGTKAPLIIAFMIINIIKTINNLTAAAVSASLVKITPPSGLLHQVSLQVHRVPDPSSSYEHDFSDDCLLILYFDFT